MAATMDYDQDLDVLKRHGGPTLTLRQQLRGFPDIPIQVTIVPQKDSTMQSQGDISRDYCAHTVPSSVSLGHHI
jgi:hypothetical protein